MNPDTQSKAVLSISVDHMLNVGINYGGREDLLLGMLGALQYAQTWLVTRIQSHQNATEVWDGGKTLREAPKQEYSERKVHRNEALEAYRYAQEALRLRMEAIEKSPDEAVFAIDPELLSRL